MYYHVGNPAAEVIIRKKAQINYATAAEKTYSLILHDAFSYCIILLSVITLGCFYENKSGLRVV